MTLDSWVEAFGAIFGLAGTFLLARNDRWSGWGFVAYLVSNVAWIGFAIWHEHWGLLVQYLGFTGMSAYGCWRWLMRPPKNGKG